MALEGQLRIASWIVGTGIVSAALVAVMASFALLSLVAVSDASAAPPAGWAAPVLIDPTGNNLDGVACPLVSECVAVDTGGMEITFSPASPSGAKAFPISDPFDELTAVACPASTQCTTLDSDGELTFNPTAPTAATPVTVEAGGNATTAIACVSTTQCTAVDGNGEETTFNPVSPARVLKAYLMDPDSLSGVSCPSRTQCTAVDQGRSEVTFDPLSPGKPKLVRVDERGADGAELADVACPTVRVCIAVDNYGNEIRFNPHSAASSARSAAVDASGTVDAVACPAVSRCTAIDGSGKEVTFPVANFYQPVPVAIDTAHNGGLVAIACPTVKLCVAVDYLGYAVVGAPEGAPESVAIKGVKIDSVTGTAKFAFKAVGLDKPTGFKCALVNLRTATLHTHPHYTRCRSPKTYTHLAPGGYEILVTPTGFTGPPIVGFYPGSRRFEIH